MAAAVKRFGTPGDVQQFLAMMGSFKMSGLSIHKHLLEHGVRFEPPVRPRPKGVAKMIDNYCFDNAYRLAERKGWRYVEGFASSVFPMHHAWCLTPDGTVVDPTWSHVAAEYVGIEFPLDVVRKAREEDTASVFYSPSFFESLKAAA